MSSPISDPRGLWLCAIGPDALEALPPSSLGWIGVDLQHGAYEIADLAGLLRATAVPVLVRAASQDPGHLARVLDTGAAGVIVPGIESVAEVEVLVQATRFPPEGRRSTGLTRSLAVGGPQHPLVLPMVETRGALQSVEQIAAVPGIDGLFVGPYDLSLSLGRPGITDADVLRGIRTVADVCARRGLLRGAFSGSADLEPLLPEDLDLVAVTTDTMALRAGLEALLG